MGLTRSAGGLAGSPLSGVDQFSGGLAREPTRSGTNDQTRSSADRPTQHRAGGCTGCCTCGNPRHAADGSTDRRADRMRAGGVGDGVKIRGFTLGVGRFDVDVDAVFVFHVCSPKIGAGFLPASSI